VFSTAVRVVVSCCLPVLFTSCGQGSECASPSCKDTTCRCTDSALCPPDDPDAVDAHVGNPDVPGPDTELDSAKLDVQPDTGPDAVETVDVAPSYPALRLNEVNCHGRDWVELVGLSPAESGFVKGYSITDELDDSDKRFFLPGDALLLPGGRILLERQTEDEDGFLFGIRCGLETLYLLAPDGSIADQVTPGLAPEGRTWGRFPDTTGDWTVTVATPDLPNELPPDLDKLIFNVGRVASIDITLPESSVDSLWKDPRTFVPGTFRYETEDFKSEELPMGIRIKGKWGSFRDLNGKSAFRVRFNFGNPEGNFVGLQNLTLNNMVQDPSMIHEVLAYRIFAAAGIPCPRTGYAWVKVNGQDYGLYLTLERYDDVFLSGHFPSTQHLYEGEYGTDVVPGGSMLFDSDEGDEEDRDDLEMLADVAWNTGDSHWVSAMDPVADLEQMTGMWAVEQFIGHWDGYAPTINNYFLHSDDAGRFVMLPWGVDQTFADFRDYFSGGGYLFQRCMGIGECRFTFVLGLAKISDVFPGLDLDTLAQDLAALLAPYAEADPRKPYSFEQVGQHVQATRDFLVNRKTNLDELLQCYLSPGYDTDNDGFGCEADCNDTDPNIHPGVPEICEDGIDQDCNGWVDDGYDCPDCKEEFRGTHRYLVCPVPRPYPLAVQHCLDYGSAPIVLNDFTEEQWLRSRLPGYPLDTLWIGLTDEAEEGHFVWWDGLEPPYVSWNPGEPNDWGGEDCTQLLVWGQWNDLPCGAELPVACEDPCPPGLDVDGDGFGPCDLDCDDGDPTVYAYAPEICDDGIDQDCSGADNDAPNCQGGNAKPLQPVVNGDIFYYLPNSIPRELARQVCQTQFWGGDLAWFETQKVQDQVRVALDAVAPGAEVWFGLNDLDAEGVYVWADGSPTSYTDWAGGQPNNSGEQDCARMLGDGKWNDTECANSYPALCRTVAP